MGLLEGKRTLVTGGTTGLGLAIAGRFQREGARVVMTGRDPGLGEHAVQVLGPAARFIAADAADPHAVASSASAAADQLGGLDVRRRSGCGVLRQRRGRFQHRNHTARGRRDDRRLPAKGAQRTGRRLAGKISTQVA